MPTVLWIARILPTPISAGDRLYTLGVVRSLAAAGAKVCFLGLLDPDAHAPDPSHLPPDIDWRLVPGGPNNRLLSLASLMPLVAKRFATRAYAEALRHVLETERFDAVVLDHYSTVWALPLLQKHGIRPAIIGHDFETEVTHSIYAAYRGNPLKKLALWLNAVKTDHAERRLARAASLAVTLTEADAKAFERIGAATTLVISPGHDGGHVDMAEPLSDQRRVVLFGTYKWVAKQMNLRAFLKAADARFAERGVALDVVGAAPDKLRAELEGKLRATRLLGFIDDPGTVFRHARLGVVPEVTGGGFKLKTLDYIFAGLPVAGLAPALEGVPEAVKRWMIVRDDMDELVEAICDAIADTEQLTLMRREGFKAARTAFDWNERGRRLLAALTAAPDPAAKTAQGAAQDGVSSRGSPAAPPRPSPQAPVRAFPG
jgi:glycosyltransferase involved in cell wall biosynthesis